MLKQLYYYYFLLYLHIFTALIFFLFLCIFILHFPMNDLQTESNLFLFLYHSSSLLYFSLLFSSCLFFYSFFFLLPFLVFPFALFKGSCLIFHVLFTIYTSSYLALSLLLLSSDLFASVFQGNLSIRIPLSEKNIKTVFLPAV